MPTPTLPIRATLVHFRSTKNKERYQELEEGGSPAVGTLYIERYSLPTPPPKRLTLIIEEGH
jgi:hypothetical protein